MIGKITIDRVRKLARGRVIHSTETPERTALFDLTTLYVDLRKVQGNVLLCSPDIGQAACDLLMGRFGHTEYADRKSERMIDGKMYVAIKIFIPHIIWLAIACSNLLEAEYYLVEAPGKHDYDDVIDLNSAQRALHRTRIVGD
jgi:hypothetical protein